MGILWAAAICPLPSDFWDTEVYQLAKQDRPDLVAQINPKNLDSNRREKLAELLVKINPKKVFIELPETRAALGLMISDLTAAERLERARILTQYNRNQLVLDTLKQADLDCETSYLKSLAYRRLRQYPDARQSLEKTLELCQGDFLRKALFLKARLAAMNSSESSLKVLDDFLSKYPKDSFSDDVLLWKAHVAKDLNWLEHSDAALERIVTEFPEGDIKKQALFERALSLAEQGKRESALALLNDLDTPQGVYWKGRLLLYPELKSLTVNPNMEQQKQGKKILRELAQKVPTNLYGYFAAQLTGIQSFARPKKVIPEKSSALKADPIYKALVCFKKNKQFEEAVWIVDRLAGKFSLEADRIALAAEYLALKRPDRAHQTLRGAGLAFPRFGKLQDFVWELAFPKPYEEQYANAAKNNELSVDWLMGLSREESGFDAEVISWAGAVGLCQLMPSTAKKSENELLNPSVNIETGAEHLKELKNDLKHPLKVIAAYNSGKSAVKSWEKKYGLDIPMDYFVELIPYEQTRNYVKKVSSAWLSYAWLNKRLKLSLFDIR